MPKRNPKLILASGSAARRKMLLAAGLDFDTIPADLNERAIIDTALEDNKPINEITAVLARAKASSVSADNVNEFVIGSDQTLEFEGKLLTKSESVEEARDKLKMLLGATHFLHSSVSLVKNGQEIFSHTSSASLTAYNLDDDFLDHYVSHNSDALLHCVGGYKIEEHGAWLFESIKGDNFTIMGMPLLPLLGFLRQEHGFLP